MSDVLSPRPITICAACEDIVTDDGICPTCGMPRNGTSDPGAATGTDADRALLGRVGAALEAKQALAMRKAADQVDRASKRSDVSARLLDETITLRRRLRRQRALLRERTEAGAELRAPLNEVQRALAASSPAVPTARFWSVSVWLPRDRSCALVARRFVTSYAQEFMPDAVAEATLISSELVTNAYVHGKGQITLRLHRRGRRLRIEVEDEGPGPQGRLGQHGLPPPVHHGLSVVEQVASASGMARDRASVWAELPITAPPA